MIDAEYNAHLILPQKVYNKIKGLASSLYLKYSVCEIPIDVFSVAKKEGYTLFAFSDLDYQGQAVLHSFGLDGTSLYDTKTNKYHIYYDDSACIERQRFTIMHEIGHILLGHKEESDLANIMANYFAAYALAPSPLISKFGIEDYVEISNIFKVSIDCAQLRLVDYNNWVQYGAKCSSHEQRLISLFN